MKIVPMKVELIDSMGSDLSVVNAARVSFAKESSWDGFSDNPPLRESDAKLINYLARHNHWTPFGHAFLSFRIKAPIFVARQLGKHQVGLVWNEVSRRYVDDEPEFWFPNKFRSKAENVKQGSGEDITHICPSDSVDGVYTMLEYYTYLIGEGVCAEQARMYLPQNMMTEFIWSGSLAAFARVCKLRLDPHTQAETREIALGIYDAVPNDFQHSWGALTGT